MAGLLHRSIMGHNHRYERQIDDRAAARSETRDLSRILRQVEWIVHPGASPDPIGIVRRLDLDRTTTVYRLVTWAPRSEDRDLLNYYGTLQDATTAAWNRFVRNAPTAWVSTSAASGVAELPEPTPLRGIVPSTQKRPPARRS